VEGYEVTGILWDGETMHERTIERLSWACGPVVREGWHHSDERYYDGMQPGWQGSTLLSDGPDHVGDIEDGLPWPDATFDYCVSHHGLMMLPEPALVPALVELRRVTKSGGWLRVSVPDMQLAICALQTRDEGWFPLDAPDVETAFCRYVTQNGATRSVFTFQRLFLLLHRSGWEPSPMRFVEGGSGCGLDGITDLDSRPNESIFMEAMNPE
jgi:SAM-dependent methyltransferase